MLQQAERSSLSVSFAKSKALVFSYQLWGSTMRCIKQEDVDSLRRPIFSVKFSFSYWAISYRRPGNIIDVWAREVAVQKSSVILTFNYSTRYGAMWFYYGHVFCVKYQILYYFPIPAISSKVLKNCNIPKMGFQIYRSRYFTFSSLIDFRLDP